MSTFIHSSLIPHQVIFKIHPISFFFFIVSLLCLRCQRSLLLRVHLSVVWKYRLISAVFDSKSWFTTYYVTLPVYLSSSVSVYLWKESNNSMFGSVPQGNNTCATPYFIINEDFFLVCKPHMSAGSMFCFVIVCHRHWENYTAEYL